MPGDTTGGPLAATGPTRPSEPSAQTDQPADGQVPVGLRARGARRAAEVRAWFPGSAAGHLWGRLNALDFVNRGILFAATLLLCFIPFMLAVQSLRGRGDAAGLIRRFGLNASAAEAVRRGLTSPHNTTSSITGLSWVFVIMGGLAAATALQELYETAFDEPSRGYKDTPRRLAWLLALLAAGTVTATSQPWLHSVGGPVLFALAAMVGATAFWWFSMWLLLSGRRTWRELMPAAIATGICWFGMTFYFRLSMSSTITSDYKKYGEIGIVFALMQLLIAVGVVLIIGAVFGVVWRERHASAAK